jgi:hypothetical protein
MAVIFVSTGVGLTGGPIISSGTIALLPPTASNIGGVKAGNNITIAADGTISATPPGVGTITGVTPGAGLTGGGTSGNVTIGLTPATETTIGGVSVGDGLIIVGANLRVKPATLGQRGTVFLASASEVVTGIDSEKAVTPATLSARTATLSSTGLVQLVDSTGSSSITAAATPRSVKFAFDAATAAATTAAAALPKAGGVMTGPIVFSPGQTFPGVALPVATSTSPGVVIPSTGLAISPGGYLTTTNNGTVSSITAGTGLGAPVSGNSITTSGTIKLLPPSTDGSIIGGVKAGPNITIQVDGEISTTNLLQVNNPYAYNSYIWPATSSPIPAAPGENGQVLTLKDKVTGEVGWTSTGSINQVVAGTGLNAVTSNGTVTITLQDVGVTSATVGATGLIPTFNVNSKGQILSYGLANPYSQFLVASSSAPAELVLDFGDNNLFWEWTLQGNTAIQAPLNAQSGQTGSLLLIQNPVTPYNVTWHTYWKWANSTPFYGNTLAAGVDLIEFTVVSPTYIVVTNVVRNIG